MLEFQCSDDEMNTDWAQLSPAQRESLAELLLAPQGGDAADYDPAVAMNVHLFVEVLGIGLDKPGYASVDIAPRIDGLTWASGKLTIPQGDVSVSWSIVDDRFTLDVDIPVGVHLRPILPAQRTDTLICDGEPVHEDSITRRDDDEAELCIMPGAAYRFEVVPRG